MLSAIRKDFTSLKIKSEDREEKGKKSRLKSERDQRGKHDRVFTWWQETVDGLLQKAKGNLTEQVGEKKEKSFQNHKEKIRWKPGDSFIHIRSRHE